VKVLLSENPSKILNEQSLLKYSSDFQNKKPVKWTFIEEFFERSFYEKLCDSYPKIDDTWKQLDSVDKAGFHKLWANQKGNVPIKNLEDKNFSESWNELYHYLFTEEFIQKIRKFSGVPITRVKHFGVHLLKKGGYQLSHIHNVGPSTLILMIYFSKDWKKGDPGGTYICLDDDEKSPIIFEPYNLDNSAMMFHDGPQSGHGVRPIEKDVERRAIQIYLEEYSEENGWSGDKKEQELVEL
jgi:hypothetical protein